MQADLLTQIRAAGLPEPETEYAFHPTRKWRWDFSWLVCKVAVEVQGGAWICGRHHRPRGYHDDAIKSAEAQLDGWLVLAITPEMIRSGLALSLIQRALTKRGWTPPRLGLK